MKIRLTNKQLLILVVAGLAFLLLFASLVIYVFVTNNTPIIPPIFTSKPTTIPIAMPTDNFKMSWDIYNSTYRPDHGILTIRKQGSTYTQTIVYPDGSCGTDDLTLISQGEGIKLSDSSANSFGDYMIISSNGYLNFYDNQGIIYGVPLLNSGQAPVTECVQPHAEQGKEINVTMSLLSAKSVVGNQEKITVATNLPDGMELMMDLKKLGGYEAQASVVVSGGKLEATFGNVSTGNYRLTVTSPVVEVQPENVKAVLGENGKNMVGNLVTFDQSMNSYFLEYTSDIEIK